MKKKNYLLATSIAGIALISCDSDLCDKGYTQLDNGVCVPDYVVGIEQHSDLGNIFYHSKLGVIKVNQGQWFDDNNRIIKNLND